MHEITEAIHTLSQTIMIAVLYYTLTTAEWANGKTGVLATVAVVLQVLSLIAYKWK